MVFSLHINEFDSIAEMLDILYQNVRTSKIDTILCDKKCDIDVYPTLVYMKQRIDQAKVWFEADVASGTITLEEGKLNLQENIDDLNKYIEYLYTQFNNYKSILGIEGEEQV